VAIALDTLAYARRLREAGFSEIQAEGQAQALAAAMTDTLATKQDLSELDTRMNAGFLASKHDLTGLEARMNAGFAAAKHDLTGLETRMDAGFAAAGHELRELETRTHARFDKVDARFAEVSARIGEQSAQFRGELADLERRMTMRLGAVMVAAVGVVSAVARLL